jgi:hypothetical protein
MASRKSTTPPVQPILPSNEPSPPVTFSPEKLAELLNMLSDQKAELAALKAGLIESNKAKLDKIAKAKPATMSIAGKTERSIKNEIETVRAFKRAGFGNVTCHVDVLTFNKWMAQGLRPIPGSKSLKVGNLRLFHRSQCAAVSPAEKAANAKQQAAAVARHDKTAKTAKVVPINANPQ